MPRSMGAGSYFDAGDFGGGLQFHLAAGVRLPYRLRAQLEFGMARGLDWRGNTNYRASGKRQPSGATLDIRQFLLAGFHDFPGWEIVPGRQARPFLGAGLGITDYRIGGYVQRFPEPDNPQGYLRPGSGRRDPLHRPPRGKRTELHLDADGRDRDTGRRQYPPRLELPLYRCGRSPDRCRRHRHRALSRGRHPGGRPRSGSTRPPPTTGPTHCSRRCGSHSSSVVQLH